MRKQFLALVATPLALLACSQPRPIRLGTNTTYYGYISEGAKFRVSIGDSQSASRGAMVAQGFESAGMVDCSKSSLRVELGCEQGDVFEVFHKHEGQGHSSVFLKVDGERITRIGWSRILLQIDS